MGASGDRETDEDVYAGNRQANQEVLGKPLEPAGLNA